MGFAWESHELAERADATEHGDFVKTDSVPSGGPGDGRGGPAEIGSASGGLGKQGEFAERVILSGGSWPEGAVREAKSVKSGRTGNLPGRPSAQVKRPRGNSDEVVRTPTKENGQHANHILISK
jgi:hypothetical protein